MLMQGRQLSMGLSASLVEATSFVLAGIMFCYVATLLYVVNCISEKWFLVLIFTNFINIDLI